MALELASFTLPGCEHDPLSYIKTRLARAFAASHATNPRNLEHYWYAVWGQIWRDLIYDLPNLYAAPQAPLWYRTSHNDAANDDSGSDDAGDTTLDSIPATMTAPRRHEVIPDFLIIRVRTRWRDPLGGHIPKNMMIRRAGVPVLIENKRAPSRTDIYHQEDPRHIRLLIGRATVDLMTNAAVLFEMFPSQSSTVLIACSGPWWSSRVVTARIFDGEEAQATVDDDPDDYFDPHADDDEVADFGDDEVADFGEDEADGPYMDETDLNRLGTSEEEYATDKIENSIDGWGSIFLLESRASDLEFERLHNHLVDVCNMVHGWTQG